MLLTWYQKPKEQWKSQKALVMFTMLYMYTVFIFGAGNSILFLNTETFPKTCSIQDSSVALCSGEVANNTCTLDETSLYYGEWIAAYTIICLITPSYLINATQGAILVLCAALTQAVYVLGLYPVVLL